ncbi:MAG: M55 family metallopeptidase [Gemmatimonadota bacterium]|nr:M55 family metallopeptidase [Gemmatimonadota bacterium]
MSHLFEGSRATVTAVLALLLVGCAAGRDAADGVSDRILDEPAADTDGVLRVLVYHDMEGLTGQSDPNTFRYSHPERYAVGRQYLTGDVNAVVAGLFAGGADEVHVVDGHGSGNPEPDLLLDELDARVALVSRDQPFDAYVDLTEPGVYDAVAVVGMHAKTGSRGFASHTFTLGIDLLLNGVSVTETEIVGYSWGRVGVPVIFASGDDRLAADLSEPMPWVETVVVKTATSASSTEPRPVDEARADLTASARRALEGYRSARAMRLSGPVVAQLHAVPPADLSTLERVPGIDYADQRVTFTAPDFAQAYGGLVGLVAVARTGYASVMGETGRAMAGPAFGPTYSDALFDRWLDFESGRWVLPESPTPETRTYHGFR